MFSRSNLQGQVRRAPSLTLRALFCDVHVHKSKAASPKRRHAAQQSSLARRTYLCCGVLRVLPLGGVPRSDTDQQHQPPVLVNLRGRAASPLLLVARCASSRQTELTSAEHVLI